MDCKRIDLGQATVRLTELEHLTLQEVLAYAPNLDRAIVEVSDEEIRRLAREFEHTPPEDGERQLVLSRYELSRLASIFLATTSIRYSKLCERTDVRDLEFTLFELLGSWPGSPEDFTE